MSRHLFVGGPLDGKMIEADGPVMLAYEPIETPVLLDEPPDPIAPMGRQVHYERRLFGFHDTRKCLATTEGHRFHSPLCQVDAAIYLAADTPESAFLEPLNAVLALTFALHTGTISCSVDRAYPGTCGRPATYRVTLSWMTDPDRPGRGRPYCQAHAAEWGEVGYWDYVKRGPFAEGS